MARHRPRWQRILRVRLRFLLAWVDRHADRWLPLIPSWGASLLIHGGILLVLALYLYVHAGQGQGKPIDAQFASQLTDDLTSLVHAERAGDPFTSAQTDEAPSLSIEPPRPEDTAINQPELPALTRFAPELASPELAPSREAAPLPAAEGTQRAPIGRVAKNVSPPLSGIVTGLHSEDLTAPFSGRQGPMRAKLVRREGGSVQSEKAVEAGLAWLARHQRSDGAWSLNYHEQCEEQPCPSEICLETETAATGLALLPLLGAGHTHVEKNRYQSNVRKGLEWLVVNQQPTGELFLGGSMTSRLYSHAIATMALCEAYGLTRDPKLRRSAQKAIDFIAEAQSSQNGGWRYFPGQPGDTSVFGWQMFALRSARLGGLRVPANVTRGCRAYLDMAASDDKKVTYAYQPGRAATPVMTAEALLARQYLGWQKDFPPLVKGAGMVAADLERSTDRNIYYWYYATQLLHNMRNDDWKRWNVRVRDGLVSMQTQGNGCQRGSWDPNSPQQDEWASTRGRAGAGRLFLTSLSLLTLEVYYRYLPLYQPADKDASKLDDLDKDPPAEAPPADGAEPRAGN